MSEPTFLFVLDAIHVDDEREERDLTYSFDIPSHNQQFTWAALRAMRFLRMHWHGAKHEADAREDLPTETDYGIPLVVERLYGLRINFWVTRQRKRYVITRARGERATPRFRGGISFPPIKLPYTLEIVTSVFAALPLFYVHGLLERAQVLQPDSREVGSREALNTWLGCQSEVGMNKLIEVLFV